MSTKEYLQQIYVMDRCIRRLKARREKLRAEMYSVKSPAGSMSADRVQTTTTGDNMLRLIARVDEIEKDIIAQLEEYEERKQAICRQIDRMPEGKEKDVIHSRYVLFHKWERIAVDLDVSVRYVYMLHGKALQTFERIVR